MRVGMILDVTHLADQSFWQAMDVYDGPMLASHHNLRALVPGDRQLTDDMVKELIKRNAVIGSAFDAWMMYPGWVRGQTRPEVVGLEAIVDHMDRVCQFAGSAKHVALGTDLDGGFGTEQTPARPGHHHRRPQARKHPRPPRVQPRRHRRHLLRQLAALLRRRAAGVSGASRNTVTRRPPARAPRPP